MSAAAGSHSSSGGGAGGGGGDMAMMPKALTDFVFDLYDSVTLSQIPEEQAVLYTHTFRDLSQKYFTSTPWPAPQNIASECNGDPLFLALYRELTHRHWHAVSRPTLRDRLEGWHVYCNLFDELLLLMSETDSSSKIYLTQQWVFDILHEFVYQLQGFCQVRSAVYAAARKQGLCGPNLDPNAVTTANANLVDNFHTLEEANNKHNNSNECYWHIETVFSYLTRLAAAGFVTSDNANSPLPVYTYFGIFGAVATSRLECLLGDYTACLQALTPLAVHGSYVIPVDLETSSASTAAVGTTTTQPAQQQQRQTVTACLASVLQARISVAYHAATALLWLRRYKDAARTLASICSTLQQGFKTGQLIPTTARSKDKNSNAANNYADQYQKQYDRMLSLLAVLLYICPAAAPLVEESMQRVVREKHGAKLALAVSSNSSNNSSLDHWLATPKFISVNPNVQGFSKLQITTLARHVVQPLAVQGRTLRSYLKLYTSLSLSKLAKFYDLELAHQVVPLLLSYKLRLHQEQAASAAAAGNDDVAVASFLTNTTTASALDLHYYICWQTIHVDEAERPRRFENYFCRQLTQDYEIRTTATHIDTTV